LYESKRRMTLISITEATQQQTRNPKIAEKEKKTFSSRLKKTVTAVRDLFLFSS
jgi:ribosomal protein S30